MGLLYGLSSVIFMNAAPVMNKFILNSSSPIFAAFANASLSFVFFKIIDCWKSRSMRFHCSLHTLTGGIFNGLGLVFLFLALQYIHPAIVGFVGRLGIVFAMILSTFFLKQRPDGFEICLGGLALLGALGSAIHDSSTSSWLGFLYALGSTLSFSLSNLNFKFASHQYSSSEILSSSYFFSAIMLLIFCAISSEPLKYATDLRGWGSILMGSLFGSCLGFWCYLESLKFLSFSRATLLRATGPLFTALIAYPFFGFKFSSEQVASASLLFFAIILLSFREKRKVRA